MSRVMAILSLLAILLPASRAAAQYWDDRRQPPMAGQADSTFSSLDALMKSFLVDNQIPGAAIAVSRRGKIVYERGFGWADFVRHETVKTDSLFRIASLTKPFTAVAILQLVERQKLTLDASPFGLLPFEPEVLNGQSFEVRLRQVTIRQLLQHRGGWDRDKSFDPMFRSIGVANAAGHPPPPTPQDIINYMMSVPLDFAPGTRMAYSNFGYCVLGRVIEKSSGLSYYDYITRSVLKPLAITHMRPGRTQINLRANGEVLYYGREEKMVASIFPDNFQKLVPQAYGEWSLEAQDAQGGWIASAPDLVRFVCAFDDLSRCTLLKPETARLVFERAVLPGVSADSKSTTFATGGWEVGSVNSSGGFEAWKFGHLAGSNSSLLLRRSDGTNIAVLFNTDLTTDRQQPALKLHPLLNAAVDEIKHWPDNG